MGARVRGISQLLVAVDTPMYGRYVSPSEKLLARLPSDLVEELAKDGVVTPLPLVRSAGPVDADVLLVGMQVATTVVTFAQVPQTIQYLSDAIARWRQKRHGDEVTLSIEARGPRGRVEMELTDATNASEIESVLKLLATSNN